MTGLPLSRKRRSLSRTVTPASGYGPKVNVRQRGEGCVVLTIGGTATYLVSEKAYALADALREAAFFAKEREDV